jgi:hypothetical protein
MEGYGPESEVGRLSSEVQLQVPFDSPFAALRVAQDDRLFHVAPDEWNIRGSRYPTLGAIKLRRRWGTRGPWAVEERVHQIRDSLREFCCSG